MQGGDHANCKYPLTFSSGCFRRFAIPIRGFPHSDSLPCQIFRLPKGARPCVRSKAQFDGGMGRLPTLLSIVHEIQLNQPEVEEVYIGVIVNILTVAFEIGLHAGAT